MNPLADPQAEAQMLNVQSVLNELRNQRRRTQAELKRLVGSRNSAA